MNATSVVAARIDRLPPSRWHTKVRVFVGTATFFDGFDALAIAFALPALIAAWHLNPQTIGFLIAASYIGQAIGALVCGWLAERVGRIPVLTFSVALFGIMSLACAFTTSYEQLFWCRLVQGLGLGAEMPIAATYISEISNSRNRGSFFLLYEIAFVFGLLLVALLGAYVVPRLGWQYLFFIGAIPALLSAFTRRFCPESPRWLASHGKEAEADRILTQIEHELGVSPITDAEVAASASKMIAEEKASKMSELLKPPYLSRTLVAWVLWVTTYFVTYGLVAWMPTIYRSIYKLPIQEALNFALIPNFLAVASTLFCAFTIDRFGRRSLISSSLLFGGVFLTILCVVGTENLFNVVLLTSIGYLGISLVASALHLYTSEIYPTRMRARGASCATFWLRAVSIVSPIFIGFLLTRFGITSVFIVFAVVALIGGIVGAFGMIETRRRALEELSP